MRGYSFGAPGGQLGLFTFSNAVELAVEDAARFVDGINQAFAADARKLGGMCDFVGGFAEVEVPEGFDFSIPIIRERVRAREDDLVESAEGAGQRPTTRAILMERILTSGRFSSANQFAMALGVSQTLVCNRLKMLNLPPDEIEWILFETK